jgi:hypothetical protein
MRHAADATSGIRTARGSVRARKRRPSAQRSQYDYPGEGGEQLLVSAQGDDRHGLPSLTLDYGYSVSLCRRAAEVEARELIYLFATLRVLWTR